MTENPHPDVVIIGGGAAGSSAALVLGRARARVVLVDTGNPSNLASTGIGGLLGNDGTAPSEFYGRVSDELDAYPTLIRRPATVGAIQPHDGPRWRLNLDDGDTLLTERVLLAMGMEYPYPDIEGIQSRWGASVFHCPFCHGWEHRDQPLAVLSGPAERALLLRRWSDDLTLITHGTELTKEETGQLEKAGIRILNAEVVAVDGPGRELAKLELADGATLAVTGLMVPAPHRLRDPAVLSGLGLETTPTGHLQVDELGSTNVAGIWAAGDLTSPMASVARVIAAGSSAASAITHDLVVTEHSHPA